METKIEFDENVIYKSNGFTIIKDYIANSNIEATCKHCSETVIENLSHNQISRTHIVPFLLTVL